MTIVSKPHSCGLLVETETQKVFRTLSLCRERIALQHHVSKTQSEFMKTRMVPVTMRSSRTLATLGTRGWQRECCSRVRSGWPVECYVCSAAVGIRSLSTELLRAVSCPLPQSSGVNIPFLSKIYPKYTSSPDISVISSKTFDSLMFCILRAIWISHPEASDTTVHFTSFPTCAEVHLWTTVGSGRFC